MPAAGRKRVEGGASRFCRNRSQSVAPKQKTRRRKKSRFGVPVAIGRNRSRFGVPVASRNRRQGAEKVAIGRDWSQSVAPKQKTRRRKSRNRSRLVAPKQKTRSKHKKSPIPQSGIRLHNVARRRALLAFNELLAQIHMQALEAFC